MCVYHSEYEGPALNSLNKGRAMKKKVKINIQEILFWKSQDLKNLF